MALPPSSLSSFRAQRWGGFDNIWKSGNADDCSGHCCGL
jgi:hypothetical protein